MTHMQADLQGNDSVPRNSDVMQPFRQDSNFAYLTGVQEPGFAVAVNSETGHTVLLAPYLDPSLIVWMGSQPSLDDLAEEYGADSCALLTDLSSVVSQHFKNLPIQLLHAKDIQALQQHAPEAAQRSRGELAGLQQSVTACRAIKTDADIACLQHASEASAAGHVAMWRYAHTSHQLTFAALICLGIQRMFIQSCLQHCKLLLGYPM